MAKEMGLDRAPIEFWKLVFLVPPNVAYWRYSSNCSFTVVSWAKWIQQRRCILSWPPSKYYCFYVYLISSSMDHEFWNLYMLEHHIFTILQSISWLAGIWGLQMLGNLVGKSLKSTQFNTRWKSKITFVFQHWQLCQNDNIHNLFSKSDNFVSLRLTLFQGLAGLVELAEIFVAVIIIIAIIIIIIASWKRSKTQL